VAERSLVRIAGICQYRGAVCVKLDGKEHCKTAIVTNAVEVDDRGHIYMVDRNNTGMHIVELTGAARKIANFK